MNLVAVSPDAIFTWTGELKNGELKFLNARGDWNNSLKAPSSALLVVLGQTYALIYSSDQAS